MSILNFSPQRRCTVRLEEVFFKNDTDQNLTVDDDLFRAMISDFFVPQLNNRDERRNMSHSSCHN